MLTRRQRPRNETFDPPPGPSKIEPIRIIDFNLGHDDIAGFVLTEHDTLEETPEAFVIRAVAHNEQITVYKSRVRWWTMRDSTVVIHADPVFSEPE